MLKGKEIVLGVTGSIAAYKSAELVRECKRRGAEVNVVFSKSAAEFVSALTFQTLSGNPVFSDLFDLGEEKQIGHIRLADRANVLIIAPCSANLLGKLAAGLADDPVSCIYLATRAPVVIAPAMNVNMWMHPVTQQNVKRLKDIGANIIEPTWGELACGWDGAGRLEESRIILEKVEEILSPQDYRGCEVIVTAGPTREYLDPVRFISNRSSGKMGYALARVAKRRGAAVTLISGPSSLPPPSGVSLVFVETGLEMQEALEQALTKQSDLKYQRRFLFMAAAVSDQRPKVVSSEKLHFSKAQGAQLELTPNPDILAAVGARKESLEHLCVIGFCVETEGGEELIRRAREKLRLKKADWIIANQAESALDRETNQVTMINHNSCKELGRASKEQIAEEIISVVGRGK